MSAVGCSAAAVASGHLKLDAETGPGSATLFERLRALPGLDDATAQGIALRGLGDPDAFPSTDPALRRALGPASKLGSALSPGALARRAERWQPWRGYAAMLLWESHGY